MLYALILKLRHLVYHIVCRQDTDGAPHDVEVAEEATPLPTQEAEDEVGGATEVCSWFGMIDSVVVDVFSPDVLSNRMWPRRRPMSSCQRLRSCPLQV